jgi:hypothetical protein
MQEITVEGAVTIVTIDGIVNTEGKMNGIGTKRINSSSAEVEGTPTEGAP